MTRALLVVSIAWILGGCSTVEVDLTIGDAASALDASQVTGDGPHLDAALARDAGQVTEDGPNLDASDAAIARDAGQVIEDGPHLDAQAVSPDAVAARSPLPGLRVLDAVACPKASTREAPRMASYASRMASSASYNRGARN